MLQANQSKHFVAISICWWGQPVHVSALLVHWGTKKDVRESKQTKVWWSLKTPWLKLLHTISGWHWSPQMSCNQNSAPINIEPKLRPRGRGYPPWGDWPQIIDFQGNKKGGIQILKNRYPGCRGSCLIVDD